MTTESTDPPGPAGDQPPVEKPKRARQPKSAVKKDDLEPTVAGLIARGATVTPSPSESEIAAKLRREDDESAHTRAEKAKDAEHRRFQEKCLLIFTFVVVGIAVALSGWTLVTRPAADAPWASSLLTVIVGGLLGYLARGRVGGPGV